MEVNNDNILDPRYYTHQSGLVDPAKLTHRIMIVGAGSVGSWTAMCLGKLGVRDITVMDMDHVEVHNVGAQAYTSADEDEPKVEALQRRLSFLLEQPIKGINRQWTPEVDLSEYDVVISSVDNITVRKNIYKQLKGSRKLILDPRMAGNGIEIYTVRCWEEKDCSFYEDTLFEESETIETPCSERVIAYNVFSIAGMIGNLLGKYANGQPLPNEVIIDLANLTMYH